VVVAHRFASVGCSSTTRLLLWSRSGEVFDLQPRHQSEVAGVGGQNRGVMDERDGGDTCISAADFANQLRRKLL